MLTTNLHDLRTATIDVARAAPLFWAAPFIRPWHLRWGATDEEVAGRMPGDELLPHARFVATRAIDIDAPPDAVWPWIAQIGFRRAGFYSYDLFDNLGRPSADRLMPEFQDLRIGDRIAMAEPVNDATAFRVVAIDPPRSMVWQKPDSTWSWCLEPTVSGGTRLVTRLKAIYDFDRPATALTSIALLEFADFPMMRHLLLGLKARSEAGVAGRAGPLPKPDVSHWLRPEARLAYKVAYQAALELWPIDHESRLIETPFGATHVIVSGAPDGAPVVLIHAASLSATQWYLQVPDLGLDHRLYAVDIMGDIGLSSQTRPIHTRADAAEWLAAVLDGLGLDRATVIGSSFGGFQATNLAVARPDLVDALVLLAPAATVQPFRLLANLAIRAGNLVPLPASVRPGLRGMMSGALPDERIVRQMETGVRGFRYDHKGVFPTELGDDELAAITCPTLLLVGDREMIYDATTAVERAARLIPIVEAEIVPGVGHLLGMQQPGLIDGRIRSFLATWGEVARPA